ncbi:MAG: hypothetical protein NT001_06775, partial [Candidatus Woesearchaeota archaeon]|nr:hypothetical protein [Candidatus Woesearchaeota archaeon]
VNTPNLSADQSPESATDDSGLVSIPIPSMIFRDRTVKVLEAMVEYMKNELGLTYHDIAKLLNRDDRTIWTVYSRAKKKRNAKSKKE